MVSGTTDLEALVDAQVFKVESVWRLDIQSQRWDSYIPGALAIANSLSDLRDTDIVFLKAGSQIAFVSDRDGNPEIYVMDADGSNQRRLTTDSADDRVPAWSPDGTKIAFSSRRDGNWEIYVMNADGTGQTRLTTDDALTTDDVWDSWPAWSPDGTKIAFCTFRDVSWPWWDIYVMNADGTGQTRLTANGVDNAFPVWSPDGLKIAFTSDPEGNDDIYVMNADGTGRTRLTTASGFDFFAAWSPDGSKIAFTSSRDSTKPDNNSAIYVMNADGTGQTRLTTVSGDDWAPVWSLAWSPAWSPDGLKIAFDSARDGNWEIYVMNADGTGQTRLTTNGAEDSDPAWSPQ